MPTTERDATLLLAVEAQRPPLERTIAFVHAHPELAYEERLCAAELASTLEAAGLSVERGAGGMATAFRASLATGRPGPRVGLIAVYDAVPAVTPDGGLVATHSCGHGPQAAGVIAAAAALAAQRDDL